MKEFEIKNLIKDAKVKPSDHFTDNLMQNIRLAEKLKQQRRKLVIQLSISALLMFVASLFMNLTNFDLGETTIKFSSSVIPIIFSIIILVLIIFAVNTNQSIKRYLS